MLEKQISDNHINQYVFPNYKGDSLGYCEEVLYNLVLLKFLFFRTFSIGTLMMD